MTRFVEDNPAAVVEGRRHCFHIIGKLSFGKDNVKLNGTFVARLDAVIKASGLGRKIEQNAVNLLLLLALKNLNLVVRLNNPRRFNENRGSA